MQPEGAVPTTIPVGLRATVDGNGVVEISWDAIWRKILSLPDFETNVKVRNSFDYFDFLWHHNKVTE